MTLISEQIYGIIYIFLPCVTQSDIWSLYLLLFWEMMVYHVHQLKKKSWIGWVCFYLIDDITDRQRTYKENVKGQTGNMVPTGCILDG